ncbi:MAG: hypothetical protein GX200_00400 [Firmicutes bacterium]|nr:hypothetical protein [Bacillota bacterium]
MQLTIKNLAKYLEHYRPASKILFDASLRSFKIFTKEQTDFSPEQLYVGRASSLTDTYKFADRINFVLLQDAEIPASFRESHLTNIIAIDSGHDFFSLINDLQDFFAQREYVSTAITRLLAALAQGRNIQEILELSFEFLGNPLMLTDSTHYLVAHAGWDENLDEPQWQYYLKQGYISNEYALAVSNDLEFRRKIISDIVTPVVIHYKELFRHPQMVSRVYAKGVNLAYLTILAAYRPFRETDFELATIICDLIAIMMQQAQDKLVVANTEIESLLIDILKNGPDQKYIEERLDDFNVHFPGEICLLCLDAGEIFDSAEKMFFVKSLMQNFFLGGISFIYNGKVLVVTEYKNNNKLILTAEKVSSLASLLQTHDLTCGVSRPFVGLKDIKLHYEQAFHALNTAQHLKHPGPIYFYEDYFLYYLVASMLKNDDLRNICHPGLLKLITRDKEKSSSYAISLYLYLQHNGDVAATAQAMHLHYNTLKYRLQKIAEILEADISDFNMLLKCKITFLALEFYHKISFTQYFDKVSIPEETPYLL